MRAVTAQPGQTSVVRQKALMPHRAAPPAETGRLLLARCVVDDGWPLRRAAERFQVSPATAKRWADRYRQAGEAGMTDRSSRPHHSPRRTPTRTERRIIEIRVLRRWAPARIAYLLGLNPATVHRVLTRYRLAGLTNLDRAAGRVIRRYEHTAPGDLVHVDVKKPGNIPDGGGHKVLGRQAGRKNRAKAGMSFLHNAVDDHSRLAYSEILAHEKKETAVGFWQRAHAYFTSCGITVQRVLTDNGSCYTSHLCRNSLAAQGVSHKPTRPYRPQANGKVERSSGSTGPCSTNGPTPGPTAPRPNDATPTRSGSTPTVTTADTIALKGQPPASRVPNLTGQYT